MSYKTELKLRKKTQASVWKIYWIGESILAGKKKQGVLKFTQAGDARTWIVQVLVGMKMKEDILETSAYRLKIVLAKKLDMGNQGKCQYLLIEWLGSWL